MENQYGKWVNLSYVIAAALISYIIAEFTAQIAGIYDLEARVHNIDMITRIGSVVIGVISFIGLWRSDRINQFMTEVVTELSRVTWPSTNETRRTTIVVMIMVLIAGLFLGGLDSLWSWALKFIL